MKRLCGVLVVLLGFLQLPVLGFGAVIDFGDTSVESAVRQAIGNLDQPIDSSELVGVGFTSLTVSNSEVSDLSGLEYCTDLTSLDLSGNRIENLSSLLTLSQLTSLDLSSNMLSDISQLSGLVSLTALDISANWIIDLGPIASFPELTNLNANTNLISDVSALAGLAHLSQVDLSINRIEALDALVENTLGIGEGDTVLLGCNPLSSDIIESQITALSDRGVSVVLEGLCSEVIFEDPKLEEALRLLFGRDNDEIPILDTDLASLRTLNLSGMGLTSLTGLENCGNLEELDLSGNFIQNITPIAALANLRVLNLSQNALTDILPLVANHPGFSGGGSIDLSCNPLTPQQLESAAALFSLRNISLTTVGACSSVDFTDASLELAVRTALGYDDFDIPLWNTDLLRLTYLAAPGMRIGSLAGLEYCLNLETLDLSENDIEDLAAFTDLGHLISIDLSGNLAHNLTPLASLDSVEVLNLRANWVVDVSPLRNMASIQQLDLSENLISDLSAFLAGNEWIGGEVVLNVSCNPLAEDALTIHIPALELNNVTVAVAGNCQPVTLADTNLENVFRDGLGRPDPALPILDTDLALFRSLDLSEQELTNIDSLAYCARLAELDLSNTGIDDLSPLAGLVDLYVLDISDNHLRGLDPLEGLVNLIWLDASGNQVHDISPLAGLRNLEELFLARNRAEGSLQGIIDVSALAGLENLTILDLSDNGLENILPLSSLHNLQVLTLHTNRITDLEPLTQMSQIVQIDLHSNYVNSLESIMGDGEPFGPGDHTLISGITN